MTQFENPSIQSHSWRWLTRPASWPLWVLPYALVLIGLTPLIAPLPGPVDYSRLGIELDLFLLFGSFCALLWLFPDQYPRMKTALSLGTTGFLALAFTLASVVVMRGRIEWAQQLPPDALWLGLRGFATTLMMLVLWWWLALAVGVAQARLWAWLNRREAARAKSSS